MPERYINRRRGEEHIQVELTAAEVADVLKDFKTPADDATETTKQLYALLVSAGQAFAATART